MAAPSPHAQRMRVWKFLLTYLMIGAVSCAALAGLSMRYNGVIDPKYDHGASGMTFAHYQSLSNATAASAGNGTAAAAEGHKAGEEGKSEEKKDGEEKHDKKKVLKTDEQVDAVGKKYMIAHQKVAQSVFGQTVVAIIIGAIGLAGLLYSEVSSCMVCREMDQISAAELDAAPKSVALQQKIQWWHGGYTAVYRPVVTLASTLVIIVSATVALLAECTVLNKVSEEYDISKTQFGGDCVLRAVMLGVVDGVGFACFFVAIIWMCTRTSYAIIALLLSAASDVVRSLGMAWLVVVWAVVMAGTAFWVIKSTAEVVEGEEAEGLVGSEKREYV